MVPDLRGEQERNMKMSFEDMEDRASHGAQFQQFRWNYDGPENTRLSDSVFISWWDARQCLTYQHNDGWGGSGRLISRDEALALYATHMEGARHD